MMKIIDFSKKNGKKTLLDFLDKSKVLSITDSGPGKTIIGMARKFKEMEKLALIDS